MELLIIDRKEIVASEREEIEIDRVNEIQVCESLDDAVLRPGI